MGTTANFFALLFLKIRHPSKDPAINAKIILPRKGNITLSFVTEQSVTERLAPSSIARLGANVGELLGSKVEDVGRNVGFLEG